MSALPRNHPPSASNNSVVIKTSNFNNPALSRDNVRSGRYYLPQRKPKQKPQSCREDRTKSYYVDPGPCTVSLKEIIESRPPLRPDLSTPGPWAYNPHHTKPLNETNAPAFTMRPKCWPEKAVGGRTSWSKTWYQSPEVWTTKANFQGDHTWPGPYSYDEQLMIGGDHQPSRRRFPAFTMGHKAKITFIRSGTDKEPSPSSYSKEKADAIIYRRSPTIIHSFRPEKYNVWGFKENTPGPAAYTPRVAFVKKHQPAFSVSRSSREGLEPLLGPYASN